MHSERQDRASEPAVLPRDGSFSYLPGKYWVRRIRQVHQQLRLLL